MQSSLKDVGSAKLYDATTGEDLRDAPKRKRFHMTNVQNGLKGMIVAVQRNQATAANTLAQPIKDACKAWKDRSTKWYASPSTASKAAEGFLTANVDTWSVTELLDALAYFLGGESKNSVTTVQTYSKLKVGGELATALKQALDTWKATA